MKRFHAQLLGTLILSLLMSPAAATSATDSRHIYSVLGLSCPFCALGIKNTFKKIKGVTTIKVNMNKGLVTIQTEKGLCFSTQELKTIFMKAGYTYKQTLEVPKECVNS